MASPTVLASSSLGKDGSNNGFISVSTMVSIAPVLGAGLREYDITVSPYSSSTNVGFDVRYLKSSLTCLDLVVGRPMLVSSVFAAYASSVF